MSLLEQEDKMHRWLVVNVRKLFLLFRMEVLLCLFYLFVTLQDLNAKVFRSINSEKYRSKYATIADAMRALRVTTQQ